MGLNPCHGHEMLFGDGHLSGCLHFSPPTAMAVVSALDGVAGRHRSVVADDVA